MAMSGSNKRMAQQIGPVKKDMTPAQKARQKASGTITQDIKDDKNIFSKKVVTEKAKTLAKNTKYTVSKSFGKPDKITTKQVSNDAYDTLARLADAQNLKGQARTKAINDAFKVVAGRMQSDRNRTASRAEASEKRNAKGTKNVSNTQKLIGG